MPETPTSPAETSSAPDGTVPRLIVGMPRAATTWLCRCLNEHPDTVAFGETLFWGRYYVEPAPDGRYDDDHLARIREHLKSTTCVREYWDDQPGAFRKITSDNYPALVERIFTTLPPRPTPGEVYRRIGAALAEAEGKSCAVEKTPHHLNWLDRILRELPEARIVVMLREPYGFMLSYKHQGDRKDPRTRREFAKRYHPFGCAIVWRGSMNAALASRERYGEQILFIANEEIQQDERAALERVQRFFLLPVHDLAGRVPRENTSFPGGVRPQLKGEDIFWMNRVAGRTIRNASFPTQRAPFAPLRIAWSCLRLPVWGVRNIISMRRIVDGNIFTYLWRWLSPSPRKSPPKDPRPPECPPKSPRPPECPPESPGPGKNRHGDGSEVRTSGGPDSGGPKSGGPKSGGSKSGGSKSGGDASQSPGAGNPGAQNPGARS